jgi:site-specific DNA recombinase
MTRRDVRPVRPVPDTPTVRVWVRRSKADGQAASLDTQRAGVAEFITKMGWGDLPRVEYAVDGVSGDDMRRLKARYDELLDDVQPTDIVICRDHTRLGRDMLESPKMIKQLVHERSCRLFYYYTGEEVHWRGADDGIVHVLRGYQGEKEVQNTRERTDEKLERNFQSGYSVGGICYGYRRIRHDVVVGTQRQQWTTFEINEAEAKVVRRIFTMFVEEVKPTQIARTLHREGVASPKAGKRGKGRWDGSCIRAMLKRPRYRGIFEYGQEREPHQVKDWQIVTDEVWEQAEAIRAASRVSETRHSENRTTHLLSGALSKCDHCGSSIVVVGGAERSKSYGCRSHRYDQECPVTVKRPVHAVDAAFTAALREVFERPDVFDVLLAALRAEMKSQMPKRKVNTRALKKERAELKREQEALVAFIAAGGIRKDKVPELGEAMSKRAARIRVLDVEIATAERTPDQAAAMVADAEAALRARLAQLREAFTGDPRQTRAMLLQLFPDGLTWTEDKSARPHRWVITGAADPGFKRKGDPNGI